MNEIQLVQKPVIKHSLQEIGASVTQRIKALEIDKLVATPDTVKALKEMRADLNNEFKTFEKQRMLLKNAVADPYLQFELVYKTEISTKYSEAVNLLKDKIESVETRIKDEKQADLRNYFFELTTVEELLWLTWKHLGIEINLSTTVKNYKDQINAIVSKVKDELALIDTNQYKAEILVEYKASLNVAEAIRNVQERKAKEEEELERLRQVEINTRLKMVTDLGMKYNDLVDSYEFTDAIVIARKDLEGLGKKEFVAEFIRLELAVNALNQVPQTPAPVAAPVARPVVKPTNGQAVTKPGPEDRIVTATFQVTGPYSVLKALGEYMKANNIEYKNIH